MEDSELKCLQVGSRLWINSQEYTVIGVRSPAVGFFHPTELTLEDSTRQTFLLQSAFETVTMWRLQDDPESGETVPAEDSRIRVRSIRLPE